MYVKIDESYLSEINAHYYKYSLCIALMTSVFMNCETGWIAVVLLYASQI